MLKTLTCKLPKLLSKSIKLLKAIRKVLKAVQKSTTTKQLLHAGTSKPTRNANQLARCNTTKDQKQKKSQNREEYQKYL